MSGSVVAVTTTSSRPLTRTTLRLIRVEKGFKVLLECSGGWIEAIRSKKKVLLFWLQERPLAIMTCCPRSSARWCEPFERNIAYEPSGCSCKYTARPSLGGGGGGGGGDGAGGGAVSDA
eukprot:scaffold6116_cov67-Phaeocystis_antarctica.AAC.3